MRHRPQKMWLGRFYWQTVQRWPLVHALGCCCGLFFGFGALNLFWTADTNEREAICLKVLGVLMLVVYGWFFIAFALRLKRGTWRRHCDSQILFFSGIDSSTGKQVASAKPAIDLHVTS